MSVLDPNSLCFFKKTVRTGLVFKIGKFLSDRGPKGVNTAISAKRLSMKCVFHLWNSVGLFLYNC